jgi:hypothetical protein
VLVERSLHPDYLSNAYLVADEEGGIALQVESGASRAAAGSRAVAGRARTAAVRWTYGWSPLADFQWALPRTRSRIGACALSSAISIRAPGA